MAFGGTALIFGAMATLSSVVKRDLSNLGKWLSVGAVVLLVAALANVWLKMPALTLAIAVDALGADRVTAVMMPSQYTSQLSRDEARAQATALGVEYHEVPIEPPFAALEGVLAPVALLTLAGVIAWSTLLALVQLEHRLAHWDG